MAHISAPGTFLFTNGAVFIDGWQVDCEGAEILTQDEIKKLVLYYIYEVLVEIPEAAARRQSLDALQKAQSERKEK